MPSKISFSNILILISALVTLVATFIPSLYQFGMNTYFLDLWDYLHVLLQFTLYSFLHWGILHLAMNSIFIYYFGNGLERLIGEKKYLLFFLWTTIFIWVLLLIFVWGNTIGISGFALALLTYYTLYLKSIGNPEYKGGITAIFVNIAVGFVPWVSLWGHLFGAIFGALFFFLSQKKRSL